MGIVSAKKSLKFANQEHESIENPSDYVYSQRSVFYSQRLSAPVRSGSVKPDYNKTGKQSYLVIIQLLERPLYHLEKLKLHNKSLAPTWMQNESYGESKYKSFIENEENIKELHKDLNDHYSDTLQSPQVELEDFPNTVNEKQNPNYVGLEISSKTTSHTKTQNVTPKHKLSKEFESQVVNLKKGSIRENSRMPRKMVISKHKLSKEAQYKLAIEKVLKNIYKTPSNQCKF